MLQNEITKPSHYLGYSDIDGDHDKLLAFVAKLKTCENKAFAGLFSQLINHTENHFQREEALMAESAYPGSEEHISAHHRQLSELRKFNSRVQLGRFSMAKAYIHDGIEEWFNLHLNNMDSALVVHLLKNK